MAEFRLNETETGNNKGHPEDKYMSEAFNTLCEWLENSADSEHSIKELHDKMSKDSDGYIYSLKTFREKLKLRYKEHVYFVEGTGRHCELVCFRDMANYILRNMKNDVDTKQNIKPQLLNSLKLISEKWRLAKPILPYE